MAVTLVSYVFFAKPASDASALDTVYLITSVYFFERYFASAAASVGHFIYLKLIKVDIFSVFSLFKTASARMLQLFALDTDFAGTTGTDCLVLAATARLCYDCATVKRWTPEFGLIKGDHFVYIQVLVLFYYLP